MLRCRKNSGVDVLGVENGKGIYHESVLTIAKELRAEGIAAGYQHDADSRQWFGERAVPLVVVDLFAAVAGHAGWDGLRAVFRTRHKSDHVRVRLARCTETGSERPWEWLEVEGTGDEVATALEAVTPTTGQLEESREPQKGSTAPTIAAYSQGGHSDRCSGRAARG